MIAAVLTMVAKDLALLWRDRTGLLLIFVLPLVVAAPLGTIYSGGVNAVPPLTLLALDQDDTKASRDFLAALGLAGGVRLTKAANAAQGEATVRAGRAAAMLVLRLGFAQAIAARGQGGGDFALDQVLELRADPAHAVELGLLRGLVLEALDGALAGRQAAAPRLTVTPIEGIAVLPRTPYGLSFAAGLAWAAIAAAAVFALALAREWRGPTLLRLRAAPISRANVILGKAIACALAALASMAVVLMVGIVAFGLRPSGGMAVATAAGGIVACTVGLMTLFSQFGRSDAATAGIGWGLLLVLALLGGAVTPAHLLPEWMQVVGWGSPVRWYLHLADGALWRGDDWHALWRASLALAGGGLACFILGVVAIARRQS